MHAHEIEEHFAYLKDGDSNSLSSLASAAGIKPEFLSFKWVPLRAGQSRCRCLQSSLCRLTFWLCALFICVLLFIARFPKHYYRAHDYDNNDKIDGLELMALILNEKVGGHQQDALSPEATAQQMQLGSRKKLLNFKVNSVIYFSNFATFAEIIDRLLDEEDLNRDGFLDFNEYSNARARLAEKH